MKRTFTFFMVALFVTIFTVSPVVAQEEEAESPFSIGADVVSSYVWRGTKLSGAAVQPAISYSISGLTVGAWGSMDFAGNYFEADIYALYAFDFGLTLGATDYYIGGEWSRYGTDSAAHAYDVNLAYTIKGFTAQANYILNDSDGGDGGIGSYGGDTYVELAYAFKYFNVFVGAGNGWYAAWDGADRPFGICRVGIGTTKVVKVTDSFSIPFFGSVEVNPNGDQFNLVVGAKF